MRYAAAIAVLLAGCAVQPQYQAPRISSLNTCGQLRHERARIISIAETAAVTLSPLYAQNVRTKARYRLARVNHRAADLGCSRGFN